MQGVIFQRKLNFLGSLVNLPYGRWARNAFEECMYINGSWIEEVANISKTLNMQLSPWMMSGKEWKTYVAKCITRWEERNNATVIESRTSLVAYPCRFRQGRSKAYLYRKGAMEICKFRTNQVLYEAKAGKEDKCILCGANELGVQHYMLRCTVVEEDNLTDLMEVRDELTKEEGKVNEAEITKRLLSVPDMMVTVLSMYIGKFS